ncbi:hypothetical protein IWW38_001337 [Coemansia aciculifera]|uniref:Uncharacterized protein n=1 Tax=Coemansia aciculifera TaxID=417176 RepID=A0ACC1M710_9FUNG|nr:hypothetical protein IWW38_001337 [Coemansia aciculifera]
MHKHDDSENSRLLASKPDGTKLAVAGYSAIGRSVNDDGDRSSHTADGGEDGRLSEAGTGSNGDDDDDDSTRSWSIKRIVVGVLVLVVFGFLGAFSALYYD